jgi:hypothetical protein
MVTIFQMITLEGWTDIMYNLSDASQQWMAVLFCVLLIIVGSFFLLNVILAVIMDAFAEVDRNQLLNDIKKKKDEKELKLLFGIEDSSSGEEENGKDGKDEPDASTN